jgi:hypothetical protein
LSRKSGASRGNLSIRSTERLARLAKALTVGFQSSPALRNGIRNRQDTTRKPLSDFHLKPLLRLFAPLASVKQFAPLANFPSVTTLMKTDSSATESTH